MQVIYYSSETLLAMQETVVRAVPSMEHRHLPWLAKSFIEPYVVNCPFPLFASHLPPILVPFMNHMILRCSVTWASSGVTGLAEPVPQLLVSEVRGREQG